MVAKAGLPELLQQSGVVVPLRKTAKVGNLLSLRLGEKTRGIAVAGRILETLVECENEELTLVTFPMF